SEFSMLEGALRISDLVGHAKEVGAPAIALTDGGNMHGAIQLDKAAKDAGIKPIIGCEISLARDRRNRADKTATHLVLLASSDVGYQNLVRIVSRGWVEGMVDDRPRADLELLAEHSEGLVGLTACLNGYVPQETLLRGPAAGGAPLGALRD